MDQFTEENSLRLDVVCALRECHKERPAMFGRPMSHAELRKLAEVLAEKLRPRIGGRYIPKTAGRDEREARNGAVCEAFTGSNHADVMRQFCISRRLLYSILAEGRKQCLGSRS